MNRARLALLVFYWHTAITLGSFIAASISYLAPYHDIFDHDLRSQIFQLRYYYLPGLIIFQGVGYTLAVPFVLAGYYFSSPTKNPGITSRGSLLLFFLNIMLLLAPFAIWRALGFSVTDHYWTIVIPVYALGLVVSHHLVFGWKGSISFKTKEAQGTIAPKSGQKH
jgi:hypothetical protein